MKRIVPIILAASIAAGPAAGGMVVERWGEHRFVQHENTLTEKVAGREKVLTIDLSALPKGAKICRARFVSLTGSGYEVSADVKGKSVPLELVGPYFLWFDAADAVRAAAAADKPLALTLHRESGFDRRRCYLEIAYEGDPGRLEDKPEPASELKVIARDGQVLLTWKEIWDIAEGNAEITWGEMKPLVTRMSPLGMEPKEPEREIRYRIYTHDRPITAANLGEAAFVHELRSGSGYIDEHIPHGKVGEQGPRYLKAKAGVRRVVLPAGMTGGEGEPAFAPLAPGYGFHAHTVRRAGKAWYAVTTVVNGVENTADVGKANTAGPFEQKVQVPEPMFFGVYTKDLRRPEGAVHRQEWYQWFLREQMTPYPRRYLLTLSYCRKSLVEPASLTVTRGHAWINTPESPRASASKGVVLAPTGDNPNAFWMGLPNNRYSLKPRSRTQWRPWPQMRNEWLIGWVKGKFSIDDNHIVGSIGCWGMMEIERPDIYAYIHGWGLPEVTKGFQAWGRSGVWGGPGAYADAPKKWNPYWRQDYGRWAREDPSRETPFFIQHTGWGAHFTEMGWPSLPRFWRAMMDARRPFNYHWSVAHRPSIRKNMSVPAFGNCTLDGMPGNGSPWHGETFGAEINAWLTWDSETIIDEPGRWEMTVILDDKARLPECRVDLTPRKCQKFKAKEGQKFAWTCTTVPPAKGKAKDAEAPAARKLGSGTVQADEWGLVTIRQMPMVKGAQRVVIVRK